TSSTSTTSTAVTPTVTSENSDNSSSSHSSHGGAIGGAIAVILAVLIAGIAAFLYRRQRQRRRAARRNTLGLDGQMHAPDPIIPMCVTRNQNERVNISVAVKDNVFTPTLDTPLASSHQCLISAVAPGPRPLTLDMTNVSRTSQPGALPLTGLERPRAGWKDFDRARLPPGVEAIPSPSLAASSRTPKVRPLPVPPGFTQQRPMSTFGAAVRSPVSQPGSPSPSSGQAGPLLSPQLEFIQSLVNRGLDNSTISNAINMMAVSTPPNINEARSEG
ncbi:hypothetical protein FRB98_003910, partial [Tulasnella sp. 332]